MDDGEEEGSDDGNRRIPAAGDDEEIDVDAEGQQAAGGEAVGESEAGRGNAEAPLPDMPAPPDPHPLPRPRAKGVKHPPVPTKAQIERYALEQHVNYEAWCPHCA